MRNPHLRTEVQKSPQSFFPWRGTFSVTFDKSRHVIKRFDELIKSFNWNFVGSGTRWRFLTIKGRRKAEHPELEGRSNNNLRFPAAHDGGLPV